jgi:hypothetical protein
MTALNEWTAELKKNEAHAWRRTRAERKGCAVRQAFSHFDTTAMRVHTAETLSGRVVGLPDMCRSGHLGRSWPLASTGVGALSVSEKFDRFFDRFPAEVSFFAVL